MRIVMFYHTLVSDWNHGNAHFLRGVVSELLARGHDVEVFEPAEAWSVRNLLAAHGEEPIQKFHKAYPHLRSTCYNLEDLDLSEALDDAEMVIVHEWNAPELVRRVGEHRSRVGCYQLFFHDTHHRMITAPESMERYDLANYDGVLAYGKGLEEIYKASGRVQQAWTWHEAADTRLFAPLPGITPEKDLVWIGNWGDGERTAELEEFLIQPVKALALTARVYGVRYPQEAVAALASANIEYAGWLPNFEVPRVFANFKLTLHIPRAPYVRALPGIPTIRVFEALACGIPLICSPWEDAEGLFRPGQDFLVARNSKEMGRHLRALLNDAGFRDELAANGLNTIRSRHTCAHRVDELLAIQAPL